MSLRRRLFTLLLVACIALAISVFGMTRLVTVGAAAREATAAAVGERAMLALAHHVDEGLDPDGSAIDGVLDDLSRTLEDGTVGVCTVEGRIGATKTTFGPSRHPGPEDILPLDRQRVVSACRAATGLAKTTRSLAPNDVLAISTVRTHGNAGPVAFALARVPRPREQGTPMILALLALAGATTAVLLGLTAHGAWVLRVSTSSLQASVEALKRDLRAPIPEPRAEELADVAHHLRTLASTLADAQERERALIRDVEEQKRLAGLGRVVAGVAHEVRNPLAGMKLRLDSIGLRPLDPRTRVDVERCLLEIGRLDRLVRSLLLASRRRTLERVTFDLGPTITERIALAAPLAHATDVHIASEGNAQIVGEREGISGVLDNLLRNAIEAAPQGGQVSVSVQASGNSARIEVIDNGPGIAPERVGELFEPFFTTKGTGTGLGLVLARATLEAHGGTIEYERRGDRTVFALTIPYGTEAGANHG